MHDKLTYRITIDGKGNVNKEKLDAFYDKLFDFFITHYPSAACDSLKLHKEVVYEERLDSM